ncbi:MAG: hypothetical protein H6746_05135 [Deltaproteobacteria bacterium]|nr:hypothetical protein [Deltaproteobacteria bacterium]
MNPPAEPPDPQPPLPARPPRALAWLLWCGVLALALSRRFVLDDAFISFRYAQNLAEGHGLVWNLGERVEGYTNFLWTLLMTPAFWLGIDPVPWSQLLGLLSFAGALAATVAATRRLLGPWPALVALLLLGTFPTFSAYATSGLETAMETCWLATAAALALGARDGSGPLRAAAISLTLALAVLTRLDATLIGVVVGLGALTQVLRLPPGRRPASLAALLLPALALLGAWMAWKWSYYGALLPNTFYAKVGGPGQLRQGLRYLFTFATSYWLWPALALVLACLPRLFAPRARPALWALAAVALHAAYVAKVGGDFMEFRFLVPALPFATVALCWCLFEVIGSRGLRAAVLVSLLAGGLHHTLTFRFTHDVESIDELAAHLDAPPQDWLGIGQMLHVTLARHSPDLAAAPRVATTAAGAIPFVSELPALDQLGLTDAWIAHHGLPFGAQLGHQRIAPVSYLVERRVQLVLGQPWLIRPSPASRRAYDFRELRELRVFPGARPQDFPAQSSVLEMPLDAHRSLVALYLVPHPEVDAAIARYHWRRFPIRVPGPDVVL